jgi:hypothetical protein
VITVNPFPNLAIQGVPQVACIGAVVSLTATGGQWYAWQPGSVVSNTYSYTANSSVKTITCIATGAGNCKTTNTLSISSMICTGVQHTEELGAIGVYPNPISGQVSVSIEAEAEAQVDLTDLTGKVLISGHIGAGSKQLDLDTRDLAEGVYLVKITSGSGQVQSRKIVKQ